MMLVAMDAGGSGSRLLVRADGHCEVREFDSLNPASVGTTAAERTLGEIGAQLAAAVAGHRVTGWWASSTIGQVAAGEAANRVRQRLTAAGVHGRFLISNDVLPLLFAPPLAGRGAVVVAGTGSGFWAADGAGHVHVAGGYEYLASDEGSAFDLGLHAVRRAAQALDGRAGPTAMLDRLVERHGPDVVGFLRSLSAGPNAKRVLADLAPLATASWLSGDRAAAEVVSAAAGELCRGLKAVRRAAALPLGSPTVLIGGLFTGCPRFAELVTEQAQGECGAHPVTVVTSPVHSIAAALDILRTRTGLPVAAASRTFIDEFDTCEEITP